ncbi:hypothetical protein ADK70_33360 [Streptomyces rimosus subsp. pseudoverticillatus]|nr:hypothetical protein ADK70_33360 [Streptomyces rimosus subsp. pseudoverticillatus]
MFGRGDQCIQGGIVTSLTTNTFAVELGNIRVETLQSVSGVMFGQEVIDVKQQDSVTGKMVIVKQPVPVRDGEVTVTRGTDKSKVFTDWINASLQDHDHAGADIAIVCLDAARNPVRRFNLSNAWASSWIGSELDADGAGSAIETVTICYTDLVEE